MTILGDKISDGSIKHVIILMQENRSFDEYFGTFPGANGFANVSAAQATAAWPGIIPTRLSSFTWPLSGLGCDHNWDGQHDSWNSGAMNGWNSTKAISQNPPACMGYYLQDDIPYHWWLAQNFVLCDNYFCSVMGPTIPNRLYMMSGAAIDPAMNPTSITWPLGWNYSLFGSPYVPLIRGAKPPAGPPPSPPQDATPCPWIQPTWNTYADYLNAKLVPWKVYDLATDGQPTDDPLAGLFWDLDALTWFPNTWNAMFPSGSFPTPPPTANFPHYASGINGGGLNQLAQDITQGTVPTVSWIIPPYGYSEHPDHNIWDGAALISSVLKVLLSNPAIWASTVLILTYDENDGHYDHVPPYVPGPPTSNQPSVNADEFTKDSSGTYQPTGSGFRVPTIVVSPWTFQSPQGICSARFDHTSIIKFLEDLTGVKCGGATDNLSPWRRDNTNFNSLSAIVVNDQGATPTDVNNTVPRAPNAGATTGSVAGSIQAYAAARQNLLPAAPDSYPPQQSWPPVPQTCQIILPVSSYTLDQVEALPQSSGIYTIPQAIQVIVQGFEPTEFFTSNALNPPAPNNITVTNTSTPCTSRYPAIAFSNINGNPVTGLSVSNPTIDFDPSTVPTSSGISQTHTFFFDLDLTASALGTLFPPTPPPQTPSTPNVFVVGATFSVDAQVTAFAELELLATDDPQFYQNFYEDTQWLSGELRVFSMLSGTALFGVPLGNSGDQKQDALAFITSLISTMNTAQMNGTALPTTTFPPGSNNLVSSFDQLNEAEDQNPLSLVLPMPGTTPMLNFALARVHMQASTAASNVRVFFRICRAGVTTADYDPVGDFVTPSFYRTSPPATVLPGAGDQRIPLLGVLPVLQPDGTTVKNEYVTIPFFATERIQFTSPGTSMKEQQDAPNVIRNFPASLGSAIQRFYGCWLDINQTDPLFPVDPPNDWDEPWTAGAANLLSIQRAFTMNLHQCLVAEISYDGIDIPLGDVPGTSAWLAQRNLGFTQ
jgi:phospholipase C